MIIAVANLSEASATSVLAVRLAAERADGDASARVLLVTTFDPCAEHEAIGRRASANRETEVATAVLPSAKALQMLVPRMMQDYDDIVIDVPGVNTSVVRAALAIADRVVLPVAPTGPEVDGSGMTRAESDIREFVMTVDMARYYNPQLRAVALTTGSTEIPDWLAELLQGEPGWKVSAATHGGRYDSTEVTGRSIGELAAAVDPAIASVA